MNYQAAVAAILVTIAVFAGSNAYAAWTNPTGRPRRLSSQKVSNTSDQLHTLKAQAKLFIVDRLRLRNVFSIEPVRHRLTQAGKRGLPAETSYLVSKALMPLLAVIGAFIYLYVLKVGNLSPHMKLGALAFAAYAGLKLPDILLDRAVKHRKASIQNAWPDALDLMIIMIEGGQSVDAALRRVTAEIGARSKPLAEELAILLTEMSILPEKRMAFDNLSRRTEVTEVKSACMALIQSDAKGTEIAPAFRALAIDGRIQRLSDIRKKAAAVSNGMTLPVFVFFLLPLIMMGFAPFIINFMEWK